MLNGKKIISETADIDIQSVRSRLVDRILIVIAVTTPLALFFSILRSVEHGWNSVYYTHAILIVFFVTLPFTLKKTPYLIRVLILLAVSVIMGVSGLLTFGIMSNSVIALYAATVFATIIFGVRAGLIVLAVDICIIIFIGIAVATGVKTFAFDANEYLTSINFWVLAGVGLGITAVLSVYSIGIIYDHLVRSLRQLKESEKKYRVLFESANDAIFMLEKGHFIDCNAKAIEMFGVPCEQVIGQSPDRFSPDFQPDGSNSTQKVLEKMSATLQGSPQFFEWQHARYDGTIFDAEVSLSTMEIDGKAFILSLVRDITERKVAEEDRKEMGRRLQQGQKMEAIGTLAGGIAHDFNNILSSILGFSELIKYDLQEEDHELRENIEAVIKSGLRAKDLVQHILTFSRSTEGKNSPVIASVIIKEAVKLLKATLPAGIEIHERLEDNGITVFGDATRIHQVIMNLCVNAAHAMKSRGGRLEIRLQKKTINESISTQYKEATPGEYLELTISDTGHGIKEEIIDRIFDPFFTTKERGEGSGMGLSVVHGIVKDMGGFIRVESVPEKGSVFYVLMPVYEGAMETDSSEEAQPLQKGKGRILLVDDELDITVTAARFLQLSGFEVTTRNRSADALEIFLRNPEAFDLVITDYSMPQINGVELSRKIVETRPGIPIILCTGFSEDITPQILDELGIHSLMMKPLILSKLSGAAINAIDGTK